VLPQRVADAFAAGDEADVPYLVGTTDAEFPDSFLQALARQPDAARAVLVAGQRDTFLSVYGGELALRQHLISDAIFTEPARFLAVSHADRAPTYRYRFSITAPDRIATVGGATHSEDGKYVFDQAGEKNKLADQICDYWVSFASTGNPNHAGAPEWPTAEGDALIQFTANGPVAEKPDPWDARLDVVRTANERLS
jgi:para-nitrobenzyl esterase